MIRNSWILNNYSWKAHLVKKQSPCRSPRKGWGMLTELMEYFLAWMSFKKGDCAFDKMTFFNRKHLLPSKCCFCAKRIPQNSIVLLCEQKSRSFGVLATGFKDPNEKKGVGFEKPRGQKIFFFLVLFKNLGKMWTYFPCDGRDPL